MLFGWQEGHHLPKSIHFLPKRFFLETMKDDEIWTCDGEMAKPGSPSDVC